MKRSRVSPFVLKLFHLLSDSSNCSLISWDSMGLGFIIYNIGLFEKVLMSKHFRNNSINSFFRQLNLYSFKRTTDGRKARGLGLNNWCRFIHTDFRPNDIVSLSLIRRQNSLRKKKNNLLKPAAIVDNSNYLFPIQYPKPIHSALVTSSSSPFYNDNHNQNVQNPAALPSLNITADDQFQTMLLHDNYQVFYRDQDSMILDQTPAVGNGPDNGIPMMMMMASSFQINNAIPTQKASDSSNQQQYLTCAPPLSFTEQDKEHNMILYNPFYGNTFNQIHYENNANFI